MWSMSVRRAGIFAALVLGLGSSRAAADELDDLKAAAGRGEPQSLFDLGDRYERGDGLGHDLSRAAAYMRLAAERGLALAQYRLGLFYAAGLGVDKDLPESFAWLSLAAEGTDDTTALMAAALRDSIAKQLSPVEVERAQKRVAAFAPATGAVELPGADQGTSAGGLTLDALLTALPPTACGTIAVTTAEGGQFAVTGYVAKGRLQEVLAPEIAGYLERNSVAIKLTELEPSLCPVLEAVAAVGKEPTTVLPVVLHDERGTEKDIFRDGDHLIVDIPELPDDRLISVDYFQHDGRVLHLVGGAAQPLMLRAGQRLALGDPASGQQEWTVGPPFGQDMIVVYATRAPLFVKARPGIERAVDYLAALQPRLAAAAGTDDIRLRYRLVTTVGE
jgi:hypothetical protein